MKMKMERSATHIRFYWIILLILSSLLQINSFNTIKKWPIRRVLLKSDETISKINPIHHRLLFMSTQNTPETKNNPETNFMDDILATTDTLLAGVMSLFGVSKALYKDLEENDYKSENNILTPKDAILLFGATGKLGDEIVQRIRKEYPTKDIVIVGRNATKLQDQWTKNYNQSIHIFVESGVDVTKPETITADLFTGVSQVICAIGPAFTDFGKETIAQDIDYLGKLHVIDATTKYLKTGSTIEKTLESFVKGRRDISKWIALNDVIMGGKSSSKWSEIDWKGEGSDFVRWEGNIVMEGGGFAGTINNQTNYDMTGYDGIRLRVRGDGKRYKVRIQRTESGSSGNIYQASFDTSPANAWIDISIPFANFNPVRRDRVDYNAPALYSQDKENNKVYLGLLLSKFEYNGFNNPNFGPGEFKIDIADISFYRLPRPSFLLVSSAGVERINRLNEQQRMNDVPIVKLNPKGILNWKYKGEVSLRQSGLPYTILRSTGLVPTPTFSISEQESSVIEYFQGDVISGRITRYELAKSIVQIIKSPYAIGKTFEVRRREAVPEALTGPPTMNNGPPLSGDPIIPEVVKDINTILRRLVKDSDRPLAPGLPPFPYPFDPPAPLTEEKTKEILEADPRVKLAQERDARVGQDIIKQLDVVNQ